MSKYPYEIDSMVRLGRSSFFIRGYTSHYSCNKGVVITPKLSRPYLDGVRQTAGYALDEEKKLIMKGWAELIDPIFYPGTMINMVGNDTLRKVGDEFVRISL